MFLKGFYFMKKKSNKKAFCENIIGYIFIAPAVIILGIFFIYPAFNLIYISFTDYSMLRGDGSFIGLANYKALLSEQGFINSLIISLKLAFFIIPVQTAIALIMANFVNKHGSYAKIMRTLYFIPAIISFVAVCYTWRQIYSPSFGLANAFLKALGITPLEYLSSKEQALICIAITCIWKSWGYFMFIYLGALQDIPSEIRDAAKIDGANSIQEFLYITIPMVKKISAFILIITSMDAIKLFIPIFTMTGGGPNSSTDTIIHYTWRQAFRLQRIGYAAAMTTIVFLISVLIMSLYVINLRSESRE